MQTASSVDGLTRRAGALLTFGMLEHRAHRNG
jgi:hypothetical protein